MKGTEVLKPRCGKIVSKKHFYGVYKSILKKKQLATDCGEGQILLVSTGTKKKMQAIYKYPLKRHKIII